MIRILVIDDKYEKQCDVVNVINEVCSGREDVEILTASYAIDAKKILAQSNVDIMILDICIPLRVGDGLQRDGGIKLLKEINGSDRYTYPRFVIAFSEHEELTKEFIVDEGIIHTAIHYNPTTNEWNIRLSESIKTAISIMANNKVKRSYDYDLAVICALKEELDYVKTWILDLKEIIHSDDDHTYYTGHFIREEKKIRIVVTQSTYMGMVPAATLTTHLIYKFVPKYIIMTGIAAGIRGKVNMGDVVVAEYVWDYGAGKEVLIGEEAEHKNTIQQIALDTNISAMIRRLAVDTKSLNEIEEQFHGTKPDSRLKLHMGAVASGAAVIANSEKVKQIQDQIRDVIAIEMEIFGVYYAARWAVNPKPKYLAIKSICDFADEKKSDDYHHYASFSSSKILEKLSKDYFIYEE